MNAIYNLPTEVADAADVDTAPEVVDELLTEMLADYYATKNAEDAAKALERQLLRMGKAVKGLEADEDVLKTHLADTTARLQATTGRITRLKSWMQNLMEQGEMPKVKDQLVSVYLQRNPKSWDIDDESLIPETMKRAHITCPLSMVPAELADMVTSVEVSKTLLQKHLEEDGEMVAGAHVVDDRYHLRVR